MRITQNNKYKAMFVNLGTADILGQIIVVVGCPSHCRSLAASVPHPSKILLLSLVADKNVSK